MGAYRSWRSHRTDGRNGGMRNRIDRSLEKGREKSSHEKASQCIIHNRPTSQNVRTDESHECPKGTRKRNTGSRSILRESSSGDARVNLSGPVSVKKREEFVPTMVNSSNRRRTNSDLRRWQRPSRYFWLFQLRREERPPPYWSSR